MEETNMDQKKRLKTPVQIATLQKAYAENKSPSDPLRKKLSQEVGLSDKQILRWFRYQRQKEQQKEDVNRNEDQGLPALQDYPSPTVVPKPSVRKSAREGNFYNSQKDGVKGSTSNSSPNSPRIKSSPETYNLRNENHADLREAQSRKRTRQFSGMDMGNTFPRKELKFGRSREPSNERYLNSKEPHSMKISRELTDMDLENASPMTMHNLSRPDELKQKYLDLKLIQDMKRNDKQLCKNMESAFLKNMHYKHAADVQGKEEFFNSRTHNIQGNAELSIMGMRNTNAEDLELGDAPDGLRKNHSRAENFKRNGQLETTYQRNMQVLNTDDGLRKEECLSSRRTPNMNRNGEFSQPVTENAYGRKVEIPSKPLLKSCNGVKRSDNDAETASIQRMRVGMEELERFETLYKIQKRDKTSECSKEKLLEHDKTSSIQRTRVGMKELSKFEKTLNKSHKHDKTSEHSEEKLLAHDKTSEYSKEDLLEHFLKIRDYPSAVLVTEVSDYDILIRKIRKEAIQSPQETSRTKSPSVSLPPADRNPGCKMSQERGLSLTSSSLKSKKVSKVRERLGRLYQVDGPPLAVNFDQLPSHAFSASSMDYPTGRC